MVLLSFVEGTEEEEEENKGGGEEEQGGRKDIREEEEGEESLWFAWSEARPSWGGTNTVLFLFHLVLIFSFQDVYFEGF